MTWRRRREKAPPWHDAYDRQAGIRTALFLSTAVVTAYLLALGYRTLHGPFLPGRWLWDPYDVRAYFARAQFLPRHTTPFLDVFSEYPTLATLSFALPMLLAPAARTDPATYAFVWYCLMAACWLGVVATIARVRVDRGQTAWPALIMLSPSVLYFSLMRFDVLCALVVCRSLAAFARGRYARAHFLLGVATFVKWYPALLFPVYLSFHLFGERRPGTVRYGGVFVATIAVLLVGTILACSWAGFLVPYRFHATRGSQYFNPYWVLERCDVVWSPAAWRSVGLVFFSAQFAIVPILLCKRIRSVTEVFQYAILATWFFITFAKIDSPQWILWYVPPALMFVRQRATLAALGALAILNYAVFPVGLDAYGMRAMAFSAIVLLKDLILLAAIVLILRESPVEPRGAATAPGTEAISPLRACPR